MNVYGAQAFNAVAEVIRAGALSTFQDGGRAGYAHLGVSRSGALDPNAHSLANRLVGNHSHLPVVETTLDGISLRILKPVVVAVTGALAEVLVDGKGASWSIPIAMSPGQILDIRPATLGVRSYLGVSGGFEGLKVLGSCSTDLLSGLGPSPLKQGDLLFAGEKSLDIPYVDFAPYEIASNKVELLLHKGPRSDWIAHSSLRKLFNQTYTVSSSSNRIALRLEGYPLPRSRLDELGSEGMVWGSVQLPSNGQLIVFLADHPTTGGYPVIGVIDRNAESACAQLRPGSQVVFKRVRG